MIFCRLPYTVSGYGTSCSTHLQYQESPVLLLIHSYYQTYLILFLTLLIPSLPVMQRTLLSLYPYMQQHLRLLHIPLTIQRSSQLLYQSSIWASSQMLSLTLSSPVSRS